MGQQGFLRLSPVFEGFLDAFAACGVCFGGLIYCLELWAVLTDHGMQVLICSNCCPPCAGSILSLVSNCLGKYVSGFFVRCLWWFSSGRSCRWELGVMFGWILRPGQVGRNVHAGSYSPAIKEVNAGQGRYLLIGSGLLQNSTAARMIQ